ncbi:phage capsid protein [Ensifer adhaerens]|uniref:phage capsid protein n=1 Tax=Ensifer adhaerens TaxID=106592 RepID=UPI000CF0EA8A|nr:phage capsid protein [Ensifer adhaerens]
MSQFVTTAFVQQYSTNIAMLLQQQGSRLRGAVMEHGFVGKAATVVEQFGAVTPVKNLARHSDTPLISTPQDRRWVYPTDYDWADLIDSQDKLRMLIDPTGPYTQAGVMAMGRAMDDEIINGFFGTNNTGENGTTAVTFPSGQIVAANVGASANTGLNVAKLRAAKKLLMQAEVDIDNDQLFVAITAQQHDNLLNEVQAISLDYTDRPVLVEGRIRSFMGFNFIHSERIPGGPSYAGSISTGGLYYVPCWAKSGLALGMWNDVQASVDKRPDKRNSWQVYVTATVGACRTEEKRCVQINCA